MSDTTKKGLILVLAITLAVLLIFGAFKLAEHIIDSGISDERLAEYESKLTELEHKKQDLNSRIRVLEDEELNLQGDSFMSFIFTQLDQILYDEVFEVMQYEQSGSDGDPLVTSEYPIVGVMALSETELPGADGNITWDQYGELISLGWGTSLYYSGEAELEAFLPAMAELLESHGLELPGSVVFERGTYSSEFDSTLEAYGINTVIHFGDTDTDMIVSGAPDGMWYPGCYDWLSGDSHKPNDSSTCASTISSKNGYALLRVHFKPYIDGAKTDEEIKHNEGTYYNSRTDDGEASYNSRFVTMVEVFRSYEKKNDKDLGFETQTVEYVRDALTRYYLNKAELSARNEAQIAELKAQIAVIDSEMMALYYEYFESGEE